MTAVSGTLVTIVVLAVITIVNVIRVNRSSAVIAARTIPVVKRYVRAVRAVGIQDAPDNSEKVRDPAIFESSSNCSVTIPFTKFIAADVRMGNSIICRSRVRLKGNYYVRAVIVQLVELI
jgi:hypothetical protein